jgi:hypothetical protein
MGFANHLKLIVFFNVFQEVGGELKLSILHMPTLSVIDNQKKGGFIMIYRERSRQYYIL